MKPKDITGDFCRSFMLDDFFKFKKVIDFLSHNIYEKSEEDLKILENWENHFKQCRAPYIITKSITDRPREDYPRAIGKEFVVYTMWVEEKNVDPIRDRKIELSIKATMSELNSMSEQLACSTE